MLHESEGVASHAETHNRPGRRGQDRADHGRNTPRRFGARGRALPAGAGAVQPRGRARACARRGAKPAAVRRGAVLHRPCAQGGGRARHGRAEAGGRGRTAALHGAGARLRILAAARIRGRAALAGAAGPAPGRSGRALGRGLHGGTDHGGRGARARRAGPEAGGSRPRHGRLPRRHRPRALGRLEPALGAVAPPAGERLRPHGPHLHRRLHGLHRRGDEAPLRAHEPRRGHDGLPHSRRPRRGQRGVRALPPHGAAAAARGAGARRAQPRGDAGGALRAERRHPRRAHAQLYGAAF